MRTLCKGAYNTFETTATAHSIETSWLTQADDDGQPWLDPPWEHEPWCPEVKRVPVRAEVGRRDAPAAASSHVLHRCMTVRYLPGTDWLTTAYACIFGRR